MKITYWSDFACPYCYIGNTRLKNAIEELGISDDVEFDIHSFELDPNAPRDVTSKTVERFATKYGLTLEESQKEVDNISQLGIDEGIDFKYSSTLYTNTRDAHRLMKYVQTKNNPEQLHRLSELLFDAYFTKNFKLTDKKVLMDICLELGLDESEVEEVIDSSLYDSEVEKDEEIAYSNGIRGVPFYLIDGKYSVPGALGYEDFKRLLIQVIDENNVEEKNSGAVCKDGICKL